MGYRGSLGAPEASVAPRIIVVGAGHLGRLHLAKLAAMVPQYEGDCSGARLVGVIDTHPDRRRQAAADFAIPAAGCMREFAGRADAAIIAAPTPTHLTLGLEAMDLGWDVLMEKPMACSVDEAEQLAAGARRAGRILQIGHVERFNPAVAHALPHVVRPRYIVCERLGPFTGRSADVDVVFDLMVHDLDIIAALVAAPLVEVRALGVAVVTNKIDMVSARLAFDDGTVAQLSAGRASLEASRKLRFFTPTGYLSVDCMAKEVKHIERRPALRDHSWPQLIGGSKAVLAGDALALQDAHFVHCVATKTRPRVDATAGLRAMRLAESVHMEVRRSEQLAHHGQARHAAVGEVRPMC